MCSFNVSFLSTIIPEYLSLCTCGIGLFFKYIAISFRFLRDINITFDFPSLNFILFSAAHSAIIFCSMLAKFSASPIDYASSIITKSSAKAIIFVFRIVAV